MILAAGFGTRLKPLTNYRPKALAQIGSYTLLQILLLKLKAQGINHVCVNVHHLGDQIISYLKAHQNFGLNIYISEEDEILDTGGGLKYAAPYFEDAEAVLIHNVDIISDLDFSDLIKFHFSHKGLASLVCSQRKSNRYFKFDEEMQLCGWGNHITGKEIISRSCTHSQNLAFSGIHIVSPAFFDLLGSKTKFSVIDSYLDLAKTQNIFGIVKPTNYWLDVGKVDDLGQAQELFNPDIHLK